MDGEWLGLVAGLLGAAAYAPYIRDIIKGAARPEQSSWLIWLMEYVVLFAAQVAKGATSTLWLIGLQLAGVAVIFALSLRYGSGGFDRLRQGLVMGVAAALLAWYIAGSATVAIVLLMVVEGVGVALTAVKAYRDPESETMLPWMMIGSAGFLAIFAVGADKDAILYVYPVSLVLMNFAVVGAVRMGYWRMSVRRLRAAGESAV